MASEPVRAPEIEGVKVTFTVQDAPDFSVEPQVLLATAKFPVTVMESTLTAALLVFVTFTAFGALVVPTTCGLKATLNGAGSMIGLSATVNGSAAKAAQEYPLGKLSTQT